MNKIVCGDCIEMLGKVKEPFADLIFADPPFNIGYAYDKYKDKVPPPPSQTLVEAENQALRYAEYADFLEKNPEASSEEKANAKVKLVGE